MSQIRKDALIQTLSKFLGVNIIMGAMLVKAPQILKIIQKKSTLGVSF